MVYGLALNGEHIVTGSNGQSQQSENGRLLFDDGVTVLQLRELSLAQQARTVRCALEYDAARNKPTTKFDGPRQRVVHGLMVLSQVRVEDFGC